ncbi:hypothetical protein ACIA5C_21255 [Actinoplanes sp. NPDC051343]|uniref:hypothetical protein n=1 Tax=Actinoplanes sp. NPDC051343 TaxID=3363906 RepID=UPI0037AC0E8E
MRSGRRLCSTALFDGWSGTLLAEPTVVVDGSTVITVGSAIDAPDGAVTVDLAGATLLPGLIDTHVHLVSDRHEQGPAGAGL